MTFALDRNTADERNGIEFLHDWMFDDTPFWMRTKHGPLLGIPYALDMNDDVGSRVFRLADFSDAGLSGW